MKNRLDKMLVHLKLSSSRSKALDLINNGHVYVNGDPAFKASQIVNEDDLFEINKSEIYVGRGAYKIEGAIRDFKINIAGKVIADIGASTGGFTDFLLKQGALKSYCVDVGHGQLDRDLVNDERVVNIEGLNVKDEFKLAEDIDLCVVDLSYISLTKVLVNLKNLLAQDGQIVALVKPQFEVGKLNVGKGGVVKDKKLHLKTLQELFIWCCDHEMYIRDLTFSPLQGRSGNQEYFIWIDNLMQGPIPLESKIKNIVGLTA